MKWGSSPSGNWLSSQRPNWRQSWAVEGVTACSATVPPVAQQCRYRQARGMDDSPVVVEREEKSLSRETTFTEDIGDRQVLRKKLPVAQSAAFAGERP